jgi:Tol biopolymer transport system component
VRVAAFDPATGTITRGARPVMSGSLMVFSSRISPDGRFVAVTNRGGQEDVFIVEVATGDVRQLTNDAAPDRGVSWSADGSRLFFYSQRGSRGYEIWSINVDGSGLARVAANESRSIWYPSASRDGKLSYYDDQTTYVVENGRPTALPRGPDGAMPALTAWSPDGSMLAGELRGVPGIAVYSLRDRRYTQVTSQGAAPHFLPDGRSLLYSDGGRLRIVDVATRAVRDVPSTNGMVAVSIASDGRTITWSERRTEGDVWLARSEE